MAELKRPLELPATSTEYLYIDNIVAFDPRSPDAAVDPTTLPVYVAFVPPGVGATDDDDNEAEWVDAATVRILVGPAAVALERAFYVAHLHITGATEEPREPVGLIHIT